MKQPKKILIYVYEDLLGDSILKLPFVYAVRNLFPKAHITWCAGGGKSMYASALAPLVNQALDKIIEVPVGRSWKELLSASFFKAQFFDLIVDTQRDLKTTLILKKTPHQAFISRTARFFFSDFKPRKDQKKGAHLSKQLIFLLEVFSGKTIKSPPFKRTLFKPFQKEVQKVFPKNKSYIGFAPGAGNQKKCWPIDRFTQVAKEIEKQGKIAVFILGPAEKSWYRSLKKNLPKALFPLQETPVLLSNPFYTSALGFFLESVVVNDAGVAHLLSLSDTKIISLFGPTKAEKVHPLAKKLTLIKASDFQSDCMSDIPIQPVLNALKSI